MGFLAPIFLVAGVLVGVPLLLHLLNPHESRRISFPALRYLQRTEREHAHRIRFRQLLVLLLRMAVIFLLVLAGARVFVRGRGSAHDPTALVVILDNSMSSGLVVGEERVLDQFKRLALQGLEKATPDDRIWVIRAGEPWDVSAPEDPAQARARVQETDVSAGPGDLSSALARARELVEGAGLAAHEIHLLSDLQASAFPAVGDGQLAGEIPVVLLAPELTTPENHYLHAVEIGGGLPPVAGQPSDLSVSVGAGGEAGGRPVPLRLVIEDRIRGASSALPGRSVVMPLGPFAEGRVEGFVETDPDALRADDRRHFVFSVRAPPTVALLGEETFFLNQALLVLEDRGRISRAAPGTAEVLFALGGAGLEGHRQGQAAVVIPASDVTLLPALNRRLAQAGIPWRAERSNSAGEARLGETRLPLELGDVRIREWLLLQPTVGNGEGAEVQVQLNTGEPWLVTGTAATGPYLLLGSPLDETATTLPVSAAMVPLLAWSTSRWSSREAQGRRLEAGSTLSVSSAATHVRTPDGTRYPIDGTQVFSATRAAGVYTVLRGDSVLERISVDPPLRESILQRLEVDDLRQHVGSKLGLVRDPGEWPDRVFLSRQGPELWKPLLVSALLLLLLESWIAAPGGSAGNPRVALEAEDRPEARAAVP